MMEGDRLLNEAEKPECLHVEGEERRRAFQHISILQDILIDGSGKIDTISLREIVKQLRNLADSVDPIMGRRVV